MTMIAPYYSIAPSAPRMYHDQAECSDARALPDWYRMGGTGGFQRCQQCQAIEAAVGVR